MDSNLPGLGQMPNTGPYISGVGCCYRGVKVKHMPLAWFHPLLSVRFGDIYSVSTTSSNKRE